jgi:hypothetical protein
VEKRIVKQVVIQLIRVLTLWAVLVVGQGVGGALFFRDASLFASDGPLSAGQAVLVVGLADAIILGLLAAGMRLRGWKLGLTLGCALLGIQTLQSVVETIVFNTDIGMSAAELGAVVASALMRCLMVAFAVALLWRGESQPARDPSGLAWKSPAIALLYVILYFSAGSLIAWRSAAVRTY